MWQAFNTYHWQPSRLFSLQLATLQLIPMKLPFHAVSLADKELIQAYTLCSPYQTCDFSFANLYNWSTYYHTHVAYYKNMLLVRFISHEANRPAYLMPVGDGPIAEVLHDMEQECNSNGAPLLLMGVPEAGVTLLKQTYPESLHLLTSRDYADYIYLRESLVSLSGKKLQPKRNFVNRFRAAYPNYSYEHITNANVEECIAVEAQWYASSERTNDLVAERTMVLQALQQRDSIGMMGGCIRANGRIVAFSMGMPINKDTFGVNIEEADANIPGAFTIINQEFARHIPTQYTYVNREEDLGIEGLRKAKLAYRPHILEQKYTVMLRNE